MGRVFQNDRDQAGDQPDQDTQDKNEMLHRQVLSPPNQNASDPELQRVLHAGFSGVMPKESSVSCVGLMWDGASIITSRPALFLGKAM